MPAPYFTPKGSVLLTGAGFSRPFGGYLASEMWSLILNQPEILDSERLHELLLKDLNYERVYDTVLFSGEFSKSEQDAFTASLQSAYRELDKAIRSETQSIAMLNSFLCRFAGSGTERGFVFTLNQDLLLERFYWGENLMQTPGFGHPDWFTRRFKTADPPPEMMLPSQSRVERIREGFWSKGQNGDFVYIKLHGSYGWKFADGTNGMAIGYAKSRSIENEPLLRWYQKLFKEVIERPRQKLIIIGYGFGDEHINSLLADAVNLQRGLEIHIVSPKEPKEMQNLLSPVHGVIGNPAPRGTEIWNGIYGYHCASVPDLIYNDSGSLTAKGTAFFRRVELA
jgi:hypothetical protein